MNLIGGLSDAAHSTLTRDQVIGAAASSCTNWTRGVGVPGPYPGLGSIARPHARDMRGAESRDAVSRVGSGTRAPKLLNLNANLALAAVNGSGKSNSAQLV